MEFIQGSNMKFLLTFVLLVIAVCGLSAQSERSLLREGNRQYKDNKFSDAEVDYRKAIEKNSVPKYFLKKGIIYRR